MMKSVATLTLLLLPAAIAVAAPPNARKFAISDPAAVDEDYGFQGEYFGFALDADYHGQRTGLQVIARGDGKFDAVLLRGGLPGAGWDRATRVALSGTRDGGELSLQGDGYSARVVGGATATVQDAAGQVVGELDKIYRVSPTIGKSAPAGAVVLFDGSSVDQFEPGAKITSDGLLDMGVTTKMQVNDFHMHLEFRTPYMPYATGQARGNSGVYIQRRYETQILDSFGLEGIENECGGLYRQRRPDVNMAFPPLRWQTYDIRFRAARFDDAGKKTENARLTLIHNGVAVHDDIEITNKTGAGRKEGPEPMPIHLQNHGNPVVFRNIWIVAGESEPAAVAPVHCEPARRPLGGIFRRFGW